MAAVPVLMPALCFACPELLAKRAQQQLIQPLPALPTQQHPEGRWQVSWPDSPTPAPGTQSLPSASVPWHSARVHLLGVSKSPSMPAHLCPLPQVLHPGPGNPSGLHPVHVALQPLLWRHGECTVQWGVAGWVRAPCSRALVLYCFVLRVQTRLLCLPRCCRVVARGLAWPPPLGSQAVGMQAEDTSRVPLYLQVSLGDGADGWRVSFPAPFVTDPSVSTLVWSPPTPCFCWSGYFCAAGVLWGMADSNRALWAPHVLFR